MNYGKCVAGTIVALLVYATIVVHLWNTDSVIIRETLVLSYSIGAFLTITSSRKKKIVSWLEAVFVGFYIPLLVWSSIDAKNGNPYLFATNIVIVVALLLATNKHSKKC